MDDKWDKRFLKRAKEVSTWSKDPSTKIGAVIVGHSRQTISDGYNGFPRGIHDTEERLQNRQLKYKFVVHAEANAIYNSIHNGADIRGATIYVFGLPVCSECAKAIIQVGISRVVMASIRTKKEEGQIDWSESNELSLEMFREAGVEYVFINIEDE